MPSTDTGSEMYQDDDHLLALLAADLDQHFPDLVRAYERRLTAYAFSYTENQQDAEDVVQEALERVYYALQGYSQERIRTLKLRVWLYTIIQHTCYNYYRRKSKAPMAVPIPAPEEDEPSFELEANDSEQPEAGFLSKECVQEIEQAVQELALCCREMVHLRLLEGLSYQEIAGRLNRPIGTVKGNIHRGMATLAERLKHLEGVRKGF